MSLHQLTHLQKKETCQGDHLLSDVIDNHGNSITMITLKNMLEKRGFTTPLPLMLDNQLTLATRNTDAGHRHVLEILI